MQCTKDYFNETVFILNYSVEGQRMGSFQIHFSVFTCFVFLQFLIFHMDWEREMLIRCNEIDIYINRSKNTKGAYLFHSFEVPRCSPPQRKFITSSQRPPERSLPPPPTAFSWHRLLLYVIEIETSIRLGLLLGTKESDTPD